MIDIFQIQVVSTHHLPQFRIIQKSVKIQIAKLESKNKNNSAIKSGSDLFSFAQNERKTLFVCGNRERERVSKPERNDKRQLEYFCQRQCAAQFKTKSCQKISFRTWIHLGNCSTMRSLVMEMILSYVYHFEKMYHFCTLIYLTSYKYSLRLYLHILLRQIITNIETVQLKRDIQR